MGSDFLDDVSMTLIRRAEDECAAHDPGMFRVAAMVLVGDVYALSVCRGDAPPWPPAHERDDTVSPFIR